MGGTEPACPCARLAAWRHRAESLRRSSVDVKRAPWWRRPDVLVWFIAVVACAFFFLMSITDNAIKHFESAERCHDASRNCIDIALRHARHSLSYAAGFTVLFMATTALGTVFAWWMGRHDDHVPLGELIAEIDSTTSSDVKSASACFVCGHVMKKPTAATMHFLYRRLRYCEGMFWVLRNVDAECESAKERITEECK